MAIKRRKFTGAFKAKVAIEAFLVPGEPINQIRLTKLIPFLTDEIYSVAEEINDAEITIINNDDHYKLLPFPGDSGYYYYPDTNLLINENETYRIEFQYKDKLVSASTITPENNKFKNIAVLVSY